MDLATSDMRNYQLARQLHLLPQLYDVFTSNVMCHPLFYQSLAPAARQHVRTVLLCLQRRLTTHVRATGGPTAAATPTTTAATTTTTAPIARRYYVTSMRLVLSFLAFPELPAERASGVSSFLGAVPMGRLELGTPRMTAMPPPAAPPGSAEGTPQALTPQRPPMHSPGAVERLPVSQGEPEEGTTTVAASTAVAAVTVPSGGASPASRPARTPQMPPHAAAPGVMTKALFFLRPTSATTHAERAAPHFGATTHLYVRMVHPNPLNEESLNPYFGRYGQVDVTPLQRTPLPQCLPYLGEAVAEALLQLFPAAEAGDTLYVQDFIIAVDSHQNAVHAVRRAYYKELVCIALHDTAADGGCNTHCIADVNAWMRRHPFVWRLRADPRAVAAAASDAKGAAAAGSGAVAEESARAAAAAAAAERRHRKRARARHRRHERTLQRRSVLGITPDEDSVDASATSSSEDAEEDAAAGGAEARRTKRARRSGSSASEHGSSSASSSSSSASSESDKASEEDEAAKFVPDVLLDGFPYWTTEDQLKVLLQEYGTVAELRLSVDDLTGAFTGCVLVRMSTAAEALSLSSAVHNTLYRGYRLISGVVNERLDVVALEDGREVRQPCPPDQVPQDVTLNERVWV